MTTNRELRNVDSLKGNKIMLITFDDGPDEVNTPRLLDELSKRNVRVTFFAVGNKIVNHPEIIRRAYNEGHTIANHTYNHKDLSKLSESEVLNEIDKTNSIINEVLDVNNKYVRCPFGSITDRIFELNDMTFIFWNIDPYDWKDQDEKRISNKIITSASDGAIVLIHDLYSHSIDAALIAIDELIVQGYSLISLEEAEKLGYLNHLEKRRYDVLNNQNNIKKVL
ncbi:MAG: polysaccharide deacetylase family protein [Bacilli bacterium]|nr:polysaccharide deacetylase family protein [Bacilli bacterium]MDD4795889.1 polysaccharide deacetylase family protein [Bacilli bacterium]